ncbi:hypothetical protein M2160_005266 [Streptomyces sp. SAI-117]|nr:hypothetical protein [Streptomyces sp. SAI-117]
MRHPVAHHGVREEGLVPATGLGDQHPPVVLRRLLLAHPQIAAPVQARVRHPRALRQPDVGAGGVVGVGVAVDVDVEHVEVAVGALAARAYGRAGRRGLRAGGTAADGGVGRADDAAVLRRAVALGEGEPPRLRGLGGGRHRLRADRRAQGRQQDHPRHRGAQQWTRGSVHDRRRPFGKVRRPMRATCRPWGRREVRNSSRDPDYYCQIGLPCRRRAAAVPADHPFGRTTRAGATR